MKLIVGLGNPGEQYQGTRHNLGFEVLDELSKKFNLIDWANEDKFKSQIIKTPELILVKPQTYMNNSGMAVRSLSTVYLPRRQAGRLQSTDITIIHDDLDLPLGKIKIRLGGAAAGHHGVESIIKSLGTDQFIRVRLGIGNLESLSGEHKKRAFNAEGYVLDPFRPNEKSHVKKMIKSAIDALGLLLEDGLEKAQNQYN